MNGIHSILAYCREQQQNINFYSGLLGLSMTMDGSQLRYACGESVLAFEYIHDLDNKRIGTDTISGLILEVGVGSLEAWQTRLAEDHAWHGKIQSENGSRMLKCEDFEGLPITLLEGGVTGSVVEAVAGVSMMVPTLEHVHFLFTKVLGWWTQDNVAQNNGLVASVSRYKVGPSDSDDSRNAAVWVVLEDRLDLVRGPAAGSIGRVNFVVDRQSEMDEWAERLRMIGLPVSGVDEGEMVGICFPVSAGIEIGLMRRESEERGA